MSDLRDLYQEVVLDHGRKPRNLRALDSPSLQSVGFNPLCGDKLTVFVELADDVIRDISFQGSGCAISTASASLLTEVLRGKTRGEAETLLKSFIEMLTNDASQVDPDSLGKLVVFAGVKEFPVRVKCATLAWRTLEAALEGKSDPVSTE